MPQLQRTFASARPPTVLVLGMTGEYSWIVLRELLSEGIEVRAVVVPAERTASDQPALWAEMPRRVARSTLPLLSPYQSPSIVTLAWERDIPVYSLARERDAAAVATLAALDAASVCVACWPRRLPAAWLALTPGGALNVHPSLLPAHRGPAPLFWTLRHGDALAGVSVHLLDESLDGGPILAQAATPIPEGITGDALERNCAALGGHLLAQTLRDRETGAERPRSQDNRLATYEGWPTTEDFEITLDRSARWAYSFIRGAAYWGGPMVIRVREDSFKVREALGYAPNANQPGEVHRAGDELWLVCTPGILHVRLA